MDWINNLINLSKVPTKLIVVIFIVSGVLLWLPEATLKGLKLSEFANTYGLYVGITCVASGVVLLVELAMLLWKTANKKISYNKFKKSSLERITNLDASEKSVLREFYLLGQNTIKLPMDHPVVAGLINAGILVMVGRHGRMSVAGMLFSMKIADFVRSNLTYETLDLPSGEPTSEDIDFLRNNRPEFMPSISREDAVFSW